MSYLISSLAYMLRNSLLTDYLLTAPPKVEGNGSFDAIVKKSVTTDTGDYEDRAEISAEAYKRTILEGIKVPKSPTATYNNDVNNLVVNYLNKDISYDFLNRYQ